MATCCDSIIDIACHKLVGVESSTNPFLDFKASVKDSDPDDFLFYHLKSVCPILCNPVRPSHSTGWGRLSDHADVQTQNSG